MLWWITRSTALVSFALLTLALALGVAAGAGRPSTRVAVQGLHRTVSVLALSLVAVHVGTVVADPHVDLGAVDVVVPFGSSYASLPTGLGTLAVDLLLAVALTSALRTRLPGRAWRGVHVLAYACWPVAALHAVGSGTDTTATRALAAAGAVVAVTVLGWRLGRGAGPRAIAAALAGLVATGALAGAVLG
jgi:sulfoxide reductase heme-binding subunit YedZ